MTLLHNGKLALAECIPELYGSVPRSRHNLAVVSAESNRENILGVTYKSSGAATRVNVPKTEGGVPRSRKGKLTIGRDHDIRHKVVVATERSAGESIVSILSGESPHNHSLMILSLQFNFSI